MNAIPNDVKNLCRLGDIHSKSLLLQIVRQGDPKKMIALIEKIVRGGVLTREETRKVTANRKAGRAKPYTFMYAPASKVFNVRLRFKKSHVSRYEVIEALEAILAELRDS